MREALSRGIAVADGVEVLLAQGALQLEHFTGVRGIAPERLRHAVRAERNEP